MRRDGTYTRRETLKDNSTGQLTYNFITEKRKKKKAERRRGRPFRRARIKTFYESKIGRAKASRTSKKKMASSGREGGKRNTVASDMPRPPSKKAIRSTRFLTTRGSVISLETPKRDRKPCRPLWRKIESRFVLTKGVRGECGILWARSLGGRERKWHFEVPCFFHASQKERLRQMYSVL